MNFIRFRQFFSPLFGTDRRELTARLLYSMIWAVIVIGAIILLFDIRERGVSFDARMNIIFALLIEQFLLLLILRLGYVNTATNIVLISFWGAMTYGAWHSDGVHDLAIYVYMLIILIAALLADWRIPIFVAIISIVAIWGMAIAELRGDLVPQIDSTVSRARDLTAIFIFLVLLIFLLIKILRDDHEKNQQDFAGRLHAEKALHEGEERFRRIFQASPIAIVLTSLNEGRLLDANEAYWQLTGFTPDQALGRTSVELGIREDESLREKFVTKLREEKTTHNPVYEFVSATGEKKITDAYYDLIEFDNKPAILSLFLDVTRQRQAQDALFRSERRMRAMFEAIPDMLFELKSDGTILQFVPSALFEPLMPPEEFLGKKVAEVLPPLAEQTAFAIARALESGQVNAFEYQMPQSGERKTFEARIVSIDADTVIAMIRDVSLVKWIAIEREKLINELEAKNAELERFVYTVSHDLKSPLVTIVGFLGYLEEDLKRGDADVLRKDIQRIYLAAYKMQDLLKDLLELSRVGRAMNPPQLVSFGELAKEALELTEGRLQERGVRTVIQPDLPIVHGDRQRLLELLQNLIDNSAKYMGDQIDPMIEIGQAGREGEKPILFVRDNGIGIAPEYHEKIFGLFNKLNPDAEGTGVGLALVKRIVDFHGGRLWVESEMGNGAAFYFTLPTQPEAEA
ncbi:MAG TPA: PAS domain S-box protein [Anaerolineales bacterium]|nr:PAS domain S-box protein [Anaerolineales bacterium]HNQ93375.1 PAS domain S-box protein [Anaerolineales bacterium]HNS60854.1 PAS domain S-box protein [Anaerolineales bacterium]